jgi:BlaI family transcriptional regulator, penicillinase repressor
VIKPLAILLSKNEELQRSVFIFDPSGSSCIGQKLTEIKKLTNGPSYYEIIPTLAYETDRTMDKIKNTKPTEGELEILGVLWDKGAATVRNVHEEICKSKDAGYTTTLKLMQIMFEKGLVTRDSSSKTHIYQPAVTREKTQKQFVNKMINSLFAGSSADLVMQALGDSKASNDELEKIQLLINELKAKK